MTPTEAKIILGDPDKLVRRAMHLVLEASGHSVVDSCASALEGIEILRERERRRKRRSKWLKTQSWRETLEYYKWQNIVLNKFNSTCQKCDRKGGMMCCHHIKPAAKYPELRYDINNGIVYCKNCHISEHTVIKE